jgi:PAS domain S-box-containing protein
MTDRPQASSSTSVEPPTESAFVGIPAGSPEGQRLAELVALQRIGRELNSTLYVDQILDLLIREVVSLTAATQGSVLLIDGATRILAPRAWHGYAPQQIDALNVALQEAVQAGAVGRQGSAVYRALAAGELVVIDDVRAAPDYVAIVPTVRCELAVPIRYGHEIVGVLDLGSAEAGAFGVDSQRFVLAIAEQAAIAIGNAQRYAEQVERESIVRRRNEQLRDLIAISHVFHTGHALEDILDEVVQAILATGGFNIALLSLAEGSPPILARVAAAGIPLAQFEALRQIHQPLSVVERIMQDRYRISQSYFLPHQQEAEWKSGLDVHVLLDVQQPGRNVPPELPGVAAPRWHPNDMLLVPLKDSRGTLLGILSVDDPQDGSVPSREQIEILELFANEAASAIENIRLYDELDLRVRQRTAELAEALRRQAAEADKTKAIVESISDAVIVFDRAGKVALCNPAVRHVVGLAPDRLLDRRLDDPGDDLPEKERQAVRALFSVVRSAKRSLESGQDLVDSIFQVSERVLYGSFSVTSLRSGEPLTVVGVLRDTTREAEIDRRKTESISVAAHELRSPMTAITSYADVLIKGTIGPVNENQLQFLNVIKSSAERLTVLVNDLLNVARIERLEWTLNLSPVSIADVVNEATFTLRRQIEAKEQVLMVDVPQDLPLVIADRGWMVQVVTNLLSNAHKYSPRGGWVSIRGRQIDEQLRLDVQDSGIGISAEDQKQLFTRFFRADNAVMTQETGTGLGLAICREILVRHGGTVQVDSELGKGSTFTIALPLAAHQRNGASAEEAK